MGVGEGGFSGMMPCLRRMSFLEIKSQTCSIEGNTFVESCIPFRICVRVIHRHGNSLLRWGSHFEVTRVRGGQGNVKEIKSVQVWSIGRCLGGSLMCRIWRGGDTSWVPALKSMRRLESREKPPPPLGRPPNSTVQNARWKTRPSQQRTHSTALILF